jgi:hypothetical protein
MNTRILALPVLALMVAGLALCEARNVTETARPSAFSHRLVSRTMPPSDPKPDGPKRPKYSGTQSMLPQDLA